MFGLGWFCVLRWTTLGHRASIKSVNCNLILHTWRKLIYVYVILVCLWLGWGPFSNSWELGTSCHDGEGFRTSATTHGDQGWVREFAVVALFVCSHLSMWINYFLCARSCCSRRAEKYFRRGARLDWPEGATSRESMRAVTKLPRLPVIFQNPSQLVYL
jgi:hypothetical protein